MEDSNKTSADSLPPKKNGNPTRRFAGGFVYAVLALIICFGWPLFDLIRFAFHSDLYSYVLLVPFISFYLARLKLPAPLSPAAPDRGTAGISLAAGIVTLAGFASVFRSGGSLAREDSLAALTISFLLFFVALCGWFLGRQQLRAIAFPLGFLIFMVPLPTFLSALIEVFFQRTSAAMAYGLFTLSGTTVFYQDLVFKLPGISLEVAPECSGIRSSLALLITSLLAGHFFLRSPWKRAILTAAVIPLAILRNGVRIFTIGELCVQISPDMINSYIHRQGGPLFFIMSLIPFFILLRYLHKSDRPGQKPTGLPRAP